MDEDGLTKRTEDRNEYMRMLRFVNKLLNERPLIVTGFFGVGKTRLTSRSVLYIDEKIGYNREWRRRYSRLILC